MPWSDFTELTLGYDYLRELERRHTAGCAFPLAPDFIIQNDEAELGYDVEVTIDRAILAYATLDAQLTFVKEV